jgi:zinc transport system substrate-binding protein
VKAVLGSLLVALTVLAAACGDDAGARGPGEGAGQLEVVAGLYPLAEVARQVGGDRVEVIDATPPGAEPHDLELTTDQVDAVLDADVVILIGGGFQPALEEVAGERDGGTVDVLAGLDPAGVGDVRPERDPHVWLDPVQMKEIVGRVVDALAASDPDGAKAHRARGEAFRQQLDDLDAELAAGLASCRQRRIVTAHEAFGWLAARYGLEQRAIAGLSPDEEPDARHLAELVDLVEQEGITTIFAEALVSPAVAEALAREAGVGTAVLNPLEGLSDAELDAGEDYLSVMRQNLATLTAALDC